MLERKVDEALSLLMGIDFLQTGEFVFSEIDFLARASLLKVYCRGSSTGLRAEMKKALDDIEKQNKIRNTLVHGPWMAHISNFEDRQGAWQRVGLSRGHNCKATNITRAAILAKAIKVDDVTAKITRISQRVAASRVDEPPHDE
jgi:hypothetical protein